MRTPIRFFVINEKTHVMHIFGFCSQTKNRNVPIRLFDSEKELQAYAGRQLRLCSICQQEWKQIK